MAFDAFIKLSSIEGESKDDGHKGWIEVLKYGLGQRQSIVKAPSSCGGACAGRADFLNLVFKKDTYHGIKSVKLEQCCIDLTQWINETITATAITSAILIALPFFEAFFYPYPEKVASMASSAMSIGTEDWKQLAEAIKGVNRYARTTISDAAGRHSIDHHKSRKLQQLWEEISYRTFDTLFCRFSSIF